MMTGFVRFNINLCLAVALLAATGCHSTKSEDGKKKENKKDLALVELHLEVTPDELTDTKTIAVNRREPFTVVVDKDSFVDTTYISGARLLEEGTDVFSIQLKFNWSGTMRLDTTTTAHRGKHIAVNCTFGKAHTTRWVAALVIRKRIADGTLTFTPDATHEEAEEIVRGLNHSAEKMKKDDIKW